MAVAIRASSRTTPVASEAGISAARGGTVRTTVSGLDNIATAWVAIGPVVSGPPATYAAFTSDEGTAFITNPAPMQVAFDPGTLKYSVTSDFALDGSGIAEGDEVWVGVFVGGDSPPGDAEVPLAVAGPFTVVA